jgi:lipoate-protein ligase A
MPAGEFFEKLADYFLKSADSVEPYELTDTDIAETEKLQREKYSGWDWSYGRSPAYTFENSARFPFGLVDLRLKVEHGVIERADIFGDFFGIRDISELAELLVQLRHDRAEIAAAMREVPVGEYISGMTADDFITLF